MTTFKTADKNSVTLVQLSKTGPNAANITLSVFRIGNFITAGRSEKVVISIEDSDRIRSISANLNRMKTDKFAGLVDVRFNSRQTYSMDSSLWEPLADALLAFSLWCDCVKLGV